MQVTRKRLFNTIQDMKGKIRVFCRVRPMLDFESERGQKIAISIPDELTAAHFWKDEKKQREYPFDQVCSPALAAPPSQLRASPTASCRASSSGWAHAGLHCLTGHRALRCRRMPHLI